MLFNFILLALATWRLTNLLVNEDGPRDILVKFRLWVENYTVVLECEWCTSVWMGLFASLLNCLCLGGSVVLFIPYAFALSAMSIFITVILERTEKESNAE